MTTTTAAARNAASNSTTHTQAPRVGRKVRFKIQRCEGPGKPSTYETYEVAVEHGANVISCLRQIAANPVTAAALARNHVKPSQVAGAQIGSNGALRLYIFSWRKNW